jgi:hypothetical protein
MTPAAKHTLMQAASAESETLTEFLLDRDAQRLRHNFWRRDQAMRPRRRWQAAGMRPHSTYILRSSTGCPCGVRR